MSWMLIEDMSYNEKLEYYLLSNHTLERSMGHLFSMNPQWSHGDDFKHRNRCPTVQRARGENMIHQTLRCRQLQFYQTTVPLNQGQSVHPSQWSPFTDHIKGYMVCVIVFDKYSKMIIIEPAWPYWHGFQHTCLIWTVHAFWFEKVKVNLESLVQTAKFKGYKVNFILYYTNCMNCLTSIWQIILQCCCKKYFTWVRCINSTQLPVV